MSEQEAMAEVNRSGDVGPATPGALMKTGMPGSLVQVDGWRRTGIALLEAATDDETRIAIRDAALRVQQAAELVDDGERQVAAAEVVQRCNREIGKAHGAGRPRNRGGRPRKDADGENRQPGMTVSRASARNYRADAEAVSDDAFETVAEAARDAGRPLDRRTVRAAGDIEAQGGDPAGAVRAPKTQETRDMLALALSPSLLLAGVRKVMPLVEFDPCSSDAAQQRIRAKRYLTREQDGCSTAWDGACYVFPPPQFAGRFASKLTGEMLAGRVPRALFLAPSDLAGEDQGVLLRSSMLSGIVCQLERSDFDVEGGKSVRAPLRMVLYVFGIDRKLLYDAFDPWGKVLVCGQPDRYLSEA